MLVIKPYNMLSTTNFQEVFLGWVRLPGLIYEPGLGLGLCWRDLWGPG